MKANSLRWVAAAVGIFALMGTVSARAADQATVVDLALGEHGTVVGQLVDAQGVALAEQPVMLFQGNREVGRAITNTDGVFTVEGVRGGVYQLVSGDHVVVVRAWSAGTEPPSAKGGVLVVTGQHVYRGQQGGYHYPPRRPLWDFLTHPLTIGAGVATAIAVPVALHNSRRRSPASPD